MRDSQILLGHRSVRRSKEWRRGRRESAGVAPGLDYSGYHHASAGRYWSSTSLRVFLPDVPILFFSMHNTPQVIAIAKSVGAQGFVAKDQMAAMLLEAVDALRNGKTFFSV
jgi:hypothetical protein